MAKQSYSAADKKVWAAQQDRIRAASGTKAYRAQQGIAEPTPAKRQTRAETLVADTSGSTCFDELTYRSGAVTAVFTDGRTYEYDVSRAEARAWFNSEDGLGEFFNSEIR